MYCIGSEQFFIESSRSSHIVWVLKVKAFGGVVSVSSRQYFRSLGDGSSHLSSYAGNLSL
jgi:hypothetical protein